jgi:hypothetical protein
MSHWGSHRRLQSQLQPILRTPRCDRPAGLYSRTLRVEVLEARCLLSATPGSDTLQLFSTSTVLFVENEGQWQDDSVRYGFNAPGVNIAFTDEGLNFVLTKQEQRRDHYAGIGNGASAILHDPLRENQFSPAQDSVTQTAQFSVSFADANLVRPTGLEEAETRFNYFVGDQANWRAAVPGFATVAYNDLYDGIDLHTFGRLDSLKYEFHVAPDADWRQIKVHYDGTQDLSIDDSGTLHVQTALGELVDHPPYIYQVVNGEQVEVTGSFRLVDAATYAFDVTGPYNLNIPLIIDPNLVWNTYLGGTGYDYGVDVATDTSGSIFLTGQTESASWVSGGIHTNYSGNGDAFVVKLASDGTHLWSTYLGGSEADYGRGIALDSSGAVVVVGGTESSGWISGGFNPGYGGNTDGFAVKLASNGGYLWSTYLGGAEVDEAIGVAVEASNTIIVTGVTASSGWVSGGYDTNYGGGESNGDGFVVRLAATGGLIWSTYLGGEHDDFATNAAVDPSGAIFISGFTKSANLQSGAFAIGYHGNSDWDALLVKLSSSGNPIWSTYVGGANSEFCYALAVNANGEPIVGGITYSENWISGGYDTTFGGFADAFVAKFSAAGQVLWSTYLGGSNAENGNDLAVDAAGNIFATGSTGAVGWIAGGFDTSLGGSEDGFVVKLTTSGSQVWSTYIGGNGLDEGLGITFAAPGTIIVTGWTESSNWAVGGYDPSYGGGGDSFVARIEDPLPTPGVTIITHGWQYDGTELPSWPLAMGESILDRVGGKHYGTLLVHDVMSGSWKNPAATYGTYTIPNSNSYDANQEVVVVFDWVDESDNGFGIGAAWLAAAADALFAALVNPLPANPTWGGLAGRSLVDLAVDDTNPNLLNFHFIGHSRGAVLNTLVTQRFHEYFDGKIIDQVTTLDPHPADGPANPIDFNYDDPWSQASARILPTFDNVSYADNYYQQEHAYEGDFEFDGTAVNGAVNKLLDQAALDSHGYALNNGGAHSDVHAWYYGTIDRSNTATDGYVTIGSGVRADWYPNGDYSAGYVRSRLGGKLGRESVSGKIDPNSDPETPVLNSVLNGQFTFATSSGSPSDGIPGWQGHGGKVQGDLTPADKLHLGETGFVNFTSVRHNPLYFLDDTVALKFDYTITDASADDSLAVYIGNNLTSYLRLNSLRSGTATIPLGTGYQRTVNTIEFSLIYGSSIDSDVLIDNVVLVAVLPDADIDGAPDEAESAAPNSGDGNNDGTPDIQQANVASFLSTGTGNYLTLSAPQSDILADTASSLNPNTSSTPSNTSFIEAFVQFAITGLANGASRNVELLIHSGNTPTSYYKYGPTPDNAAPHWYEFLFDGVTGAEITGNHILLHFVDGLRGDDDLAANGRIVDIGGPAFAGVPGDYDRNGFTNELDYRVWQSSFGAMTGVGVGADGNGDGSIDAADYVGWRKNLGATTTPQQTHGTIGGSFGQNTMESQVQSASLLPQDEAIVTAAQDISSSGVADSSSGAMPGASVGSVTLAIPQDSFNVVTQQLDTSVTTPLNNFVFFSGVEPARYDVTVPPHLNTKVQSGHGAELVLREYDGLATWLDRLSVKSRQHAKDYDEYFYSRQSGDLSNSLLDSIDLAFERLSTTLLSSCALSRQ